MKRPLFGILLYLFGILHKAAHGYLAPMALGTATLALGYLLYWMTAKGQLSNIHRLFTNLLLTDGPKGNIMILLKP